MLEIQKFLIEHKEDWKTILTKKPYSLTVREKDDFILFMYNQIESDFDIPFVQECRGLILEKDSFRVLCMAYRKFFNAPEGRAAKIDWNTAKILEKIDGSLLKLWWYNEWRVSTMSMIDAKECTLQNDLDDKFPTFYSLFVEAAKNSSLNVENLNRDFTYIFELVSPYNRVVVPYNGIAIYHTGTRNNLTLEEIDIDIGVQKPKTYSFKTEAEVMAVAAALPFSEEGYVVVDADWNRVKIKGPAYLAIHHLKNNGVINKKRALALIMINEHEEFLSYFDTYRPYFDNIEAAFKLYLGKIASDIAYIDGKTFSTKKDYALTVKIMTNSSLMFLLYEGKVKKENWEKYVRSLPADRLIDYLMLDVKEILTTEE